MHLEFGGRAIVCLTALPASGLDLAAFEKAVGLPRPRTQLQQPQLLVAEYPSVRLLLTPNGRAELAAKPSAGNDVVARAARELIRQAAPFPFKGIGFNGSLRLRLERGSPDPVAPLLNEERVVAGLGATPTRRGIKLIYPLGDSRGTLDIAPNPNDDLLWMASINRHYVGQPTDEVLDRAISWFGGISEWLGTVVRKLLVVDPEENEHAA
jgi:hypothetical protein